MDYGHATKSTDAPAFFTSGAGTNDENVNNFESEDNLDLTNDLTNWAPQIEHDKQGIGSSAISSFEAGMPLPGKMEQNTPVLGEIKPYLPPGANPGEALTAPSLATDSEIIEQSLTPTLKSVKTTEYLNAEGIKALDNSIQKFNQDGNAAEFYDEVRNAMEVNLDNSYNRKLGS